MKKICIFIVVVVMVLISPAAVLADTMEGDVIVSLGANLTENEKTELLEEFDVPEGAQQIVVTNEEEHQYLGDYVPESKIGRKAISSAKITYTKEGSGITVKTKNINYITDAIYINALTTAGVKDADIYVAAPYSVSGTAALTGIIKAYETSTGKNINEEVKQFANEEMVTTAELGESIGSENASNIIAAIKEQIAEKNPKTEEEIKNIINNVINNYNIQLTDEQMKQLTDLFNKMKNLNIDWNKLGDQLKNISDKAQAYLNSDEGQSFLSSVKAIFKSFFEWVASLF